MKSKKQEVKSNTFSAIGSTLKRYSLSIKREISGNVKKIKSTLGSIPAWARSRPAAFKKWRIEDRKKKKYRSFRLQKKIKPEPRIVPSVRRLLKDTLLFIWQFKKIFIGIFLIHFAIYFLLVRTPVTTDIGSVTDSVQSAFGENKGSAGETFTTLGSVIGISSVSQTNTLASTVLFLFMSFVYIWAIRQLHAKQQIQVRDAYYQSLTPAVPSLLVLLIASIQLIPFVVASFVYATARAGGLFKSGFEDLSIFIITALIAVLCFYWLTSTIIAFYIVTLPGMYPLQALKAAKKLVQFRRLAIFKRVVVLPVILALTYTVLLLLALKLLPSQVFIAAEVVQLVFLPFIHTYLYKLYRALI